MVSRPEIVAYKSNAAVVFFVNFSISLFLQPQRQGSVAAGRDSTVICKTSITRHKSRCSPAVHLKPDVIRSSARVDATRFKRRT